MIGFWIGDFFLKAWDFNRLGCMCSVMGLSDLLKLNQGAWLVVVVEIAFVIQRTVVRKGFSGWCHRFDIYTGWKGTLDSVNLICWLDHSCLLSALQYIGTQRAMVFILSPSIYLSLSCLGPSWDVIVNPWIRMSSNRACGNFSAWFCLVYRIPLKPLVNSESNLSCIK